jgi:DNA-binding response OmpR family regulator
MRVLVAEDERRMAALLKRGLTEEGHQVFIAHDGKEGLEIARSAEFDVLVLDVMLPEMDGLTMTRRLREENNQTPVILLTARDTAADIVAGLDSGADDYITKPFPFEIFLARVRAVSRRGVVPQAACLEVADLKLNPSSREVTRGGQAISLTLREFRLLELMMRNQGRVVSRDTILESVWGFENDIAPNTIEAFVHNLRLKLESGGPKLIQTVRGVGYMMRAS